MSDPTTDPAIDPTMDPASARQALARIQASAITAAGAASQDRRRHARYAAGIGIAMGFYVFATMYLQSRSLPLWVLSLVVYVLALGALTVTFNRTRRASFYGWRRTYQLALTISMVIYVAGIVVNTIWFAQVLWLAVLFGVAVALPMIIAAWRTVRAAR